MVFIELYFKLSEAEENIAKGDQGIEFFEDANKLRSNVHIPINDEKVMKSACPYDCFDCCSFDINVSNDKVEKISANLDADLTGGFICKKGSAHQEKMYRSDRLRYPQLKTEKGYERIPWNQAYELITKKIKEAQSEFGLTSVGCYRSGGAAGVLKGAHEVFFEHLGGYTDYTGGLCSAAGIEATNRDFGKTLCHHPDDSENSKIIVLWGRNPMETNLHLVPYIKKAKSRGCRVYLIDPIASKSAVLADIHIKLRPDSDWAFGAACIASSLRNGLISRTFINNHLNDRYGTIKYLENLTKKKYECLLDFAGISNEMIESFCHDISKNGPASTYIGYGPQRYNDGGLNIRTINLLWAITGNVGIPGGGVNFANQTNKGMLNLDFAMPKKKAVVGEIRQGWFSEEMIEADPQVQVLFISCANPVSQMPNSIGVRKALGNVPFKISLEHFMTDTAEMCELVLPVSYFTESEDIITSGMWNSSLKYVSKCVEPLEECKVEFDIYQDLAIRLGLEEYPKYDSTLWLGKVMEKFGTLGLTFEKLKEKGSVESPLQKQVQWEDNLFATQDGKFHAFDKDQLEKKITELGKSKDELSINLITVHWRDQINSQHSVIQKEQDLPILHIHPETAEAFGLAEGDIATAITISVTIAYEKKLKFRISVTEKASPYAAYTRQGVCQAFGGSINTLTSSGESDIGGQAILNDVKIRLEEV